MNVEVGTALHEIAAELAQLRAGLDRAPVSEARAAVESLRARLLGSVVNESFVVREYLGELARRAAVAWLAQAFDRALELEAARLAIELTCLAEGAVPITSLRVLAETGAERYRTARAGGRARTA